jgi:hypothetical protein
LEPRKERSGWEFSGVVPRRDVIGTSAVGD